jgi:hypothetical protein
MEALRSRIAQGKLKVLDLLADINVRYLDEEEIRRYDPNFQSFHKIMLYCITEQDYQG